MKKNILLLILLIFINISPIFSNSFYVTNTNDNGSGSLREAINNANFSNGADSIKFNIPKSDQGYNIISEVWTIAPDSALPVLWGGQTVIDGASQTANQGNTNLNGPEILLNGNNVLDYAFALVSYGNTIKNLIIGQFNNAIVIYTAAAYSNSISDNYIGVNYNGNLPLANNIGIVINKDASNNTIINNVISGNIVAGIAISETKDNFIKDNLIGTNALGIASIPNNDGILLSNTTGNVIGGQFLTDRNVISGNINSGVLMNGNGTRNNFLFGNYIGADISGIKKLSNYIGIILKSQSNSNVIGGATITERNVVSGNIEIGIYIESSDSNKISGNFVGPDITGNVAFAIGGDTLMQGNGIEINTYSKYNIIGGSTSGERNIISGNRIYGFIYYGNSSHNSLIGNYIGTNLNGTASLPNATGVCVDAAANHNLIEKNVLSGNISYGIFIVTNGSFYNEVKGNLIGTNASGSDTIPNDVGLLLAGGTRYNTIGGINNTDKNIISGNHYDGIQISDQKTDYNSIIGNYIGTDITGTKKIANHIGVNIATNPKHNLFNNNLISGNKRMGIVLTEHADSNKFINNKIGTAVNGISDIGNGSAGIVIAYGPKWNIIGEIAAGNIIANNDSGGVMIIDNDTKFNKISANSIWNNLVPGIDIFPPLVNQNDAGDNDSGPNDMMNFPVISSAEFYNTKNYTIVKGTLDTHQPQLCKIEIFKAIPNYFGNGDGKTYLGYTMPDIAGNWRDTITNAINNEVLTTTAADELMNTSEFSTNKTIVLYADVDEPSLGALSLLVYPNPFKGKITFQLTNNSDSKSMIKISIFDLFGKLVYANTYEENTFSVSRTQFKNGIYFYKIETHSQIINGKIIAE